MFRAARTPEQTKTPVPYASRYAAGYGGGLFAPSGDEAQLRAMGGNGTLFAIVDAYATAMSGVEWGLYRSLPPGAAEGTERQPAPGHPALELWDYINAHYDQPLFVATITQHLELVGTGFAVVVKFGSLPVEIWPVMPHRMEPVPHPEKFIAGWIYHGPSGERIPLANDVVIRMVRTPCPWDPFRGMGAVQTIMTDLYGASAASEWHRKFFANSARPDGIVEVPNSLSDPEFDEMNLRWKEAHQGVNNAHRVAFLEHGATWKPAGYSPHDMQFVELRRADAENIREAFRMSETVLGRGETLNRATAEAQMFQFAATHVVPRLESVWKKGFLNGRLLPMYGPTGRGVEFDYISPVPEDKEAKDRNIVATSAAYKNFVDAGVDGSDPEMLRHLGLPAMKQAPKPEPAPPPAPPPALPAAEPAEPEARLAIAAHQHGHARTPRLAIAAAGQGEDDEPDGEPDLSGVLDDLNAALDQLEKDYQPILERQIDSLADQIEQAIEDRLVDDATAVSGIAVPPELLGEEELQKAMDLMATAAAARAASETAAEDVELDEDDLYQQVEEDTAEIADLATAVAGTVAGGLALSAATEALRLWSPGVTGRTVAGQVRAFLRALKGSGRMAAFGAALHRATNLGRGAAFTVALQVKPEGRAIASEQNDRQRCFPCGTFDGHVFSSIDAAQAMYGGGGYPGCLGKGRCRGVYYLDWSG